ncbi:MAG: autotransporter domain-containing protein, partial [Opitutaceae bacterium]|nr:autotransporter domain-containing protein [Opitutaceae bacterium]
NAGGGVIAMDVSRFTTGIQNPAVPPAPGVFDSVVMTNVRLVASATVTGAGAFTLADRSTGAAFPSPSSVDIIQSGEPVATAAYGHTVAVQATGSAQGLYLAHGITGINILAGKTLVLDNTGAAQSTLASSISGPGALDLRAAADSAITLTAANTYAGATRILSGTVMISSTAAFLNSESVTIEKGAVLDTSRVGNNTRNTVVRELSGAGDIYLGDNTLQIEITGTTEFSGAFTGTNFTMGRLVKRGAGTLTLSGNSRFGDRTYVDAGRLRVTSPGALGNGAYAIIAPGAVLEFNGVHNSVAGKLWYQGNGRVEVIDSSIEFEAPNNLLGSLAISGNSFVTAAGASGTGINTNSGTGVPIAFEGSLGGKNVAVTVGAGSTLAIAPRSVIAWGDVMGNSGTVWAGSLALDGGALRLSPGATLGVTNAVTITNGGKITFGGGGVSHLAAASFNAVTDPFATGALSLYDVPEGMTLSVSARPGGGYDYIVVNQAASPLRGLNLALNATAAALDAVDSHLDDHFILPLAQPFPDAKRAWANTAWLKGIVSDSDYEKTAAGPGHDERARGFVAGIDARTRHHLLVGLYAGTTDSDLTTTNDLTVESAQHFAGAYAALRLGSFFVNASVNAGKADADVFRAEPAGRTDGTYSAGTLAGGIGAGLALHAWEGALVKPSVTLRHTRIKIKDYEERGPGAMLVPDFSDTLLQSIVRVQADQSFTLFDHPATAGLSLGWKHALREPEDSLDAAFVSSPGTTITLLGGETRKSSALIGLSLRAALGVNTVLSLHAEHEVSADRARNTASLSLAHSW